MRMPAAPLPFGIATPAAPHEPRVEIRAGGAVLGLFVVGFMGWSAFAHLDSAVHSAGVVRVAGNRQAVQSMNGGVISALHVREGQRVRAGNVLVEFATTEALAQERSLAAHVFGLQAEIARIGAERAGEATVAEPFGWAALSGDDRRDAQRALAGEQAALNAQRALLSSQRAVLRQRIVETGEQITGYNERQTSNSRQDELNDDELTSVRQLYAKGFAPRTRMLALERSGAAIQGEIGATTAEIARLRSAAGETRMQMMQLADQRQQENTDRLRTGETELQSALAQWKSARDQLERTRLRAPVSGMVIGLAVNTVGGVAAPGQKLMEIVPTNGDLVVEAQVGLGDANDLRTGQKADIRIEGMRGRMLTPLHGTISRVSADSLTDEHTGRTYYTATVQVPRSELARIGREAGLDGTVRPGTPVDVTVPLRSRTALGYWLEPLLSRFSGALSEG